MKKRFDFCFLWLLCLCVPALAAAPLQPLNPGEFEALRTARQGQAFIVTLWGLDCPHCRPELAQLAKFARSRPDARLIVINTDSIAETETIHSVLARAGFRGAEPRRAELRIFGDAAPERLRFEIDRKWGGELPRNYLFDRSGSVTALSGPLPGADLAAWARRNGISAR